MKITNFILLLLLLTSFIKASELEVEKLIYKQSTSSKIHFSKKELEWIENNPVVTYSEVNWKPLSIIQNSTMSGIMGDYLQLISKETGIKFEFKKSDSWSNVLEKFKTKEIDIVPGIGSSPQELALGSVSDVYVNYPMAIVVDEKYKYIDSLDNLKSQTIAVPKFYTSYNFIIQSHPEINIVTTDTIEEALLLVNSGKADAFVGHIATSLYYLNLLDLKNLKIAGKTSFRFEHRYLIQVSNPELTTIINKAIRSIQKHDKEIINLKWIHTKVKEEADLTLVYLALGFIVFIVLLIVLRQVIISKHSKKLELLNERLELALLGNHDGVFDLNLTDNSVYYSPRWKEMLGYRDDELSNKVSTWEALVHPKDRDSVWSGIQKHLDGETEYYDGAHRLKHKDGHWVWIQDRAKAIYNEEGKAIRLIGTHTDITTQKAIELKFSQQAQMIEQIHDSIIATDMEGIITSFNYGSQVQLEYKPDEIVGSHVSKLYLEEDLESLGRNIEILKRDGEVSSEVRLVKKSGEVIVADLSLSIIRDEKNIPVGMVGYAQNISMRKKSENDLREQHKYLQSIMDGVEDPIMVIKEDYTVELMNDSLRKSIDDIEIADKNSPKCYEISHHRSTPCDGFSHPCPLRDVLESKEHVTVVHNHDTKDGKNRYIELSATPLFDKDEKCIGIIEAARDVTGHLSIQDELREQKNILDHQAHHDALTGLPNRVLFNDRLLKAIDKGKRNKTKFALLFIDLDHFKEINDSLGHAVGDEILKIVTSRLKETIREEDTVARLGGDEFTVVLEDLNQVNDASVIAAKILETLSSFIDVKDNTLYVSSSIGISIYPDDGDSSQNLLKFADSAMYKAKDEGRNNYQYYNSSMTELAFQRVAMETSLRNAIKEEEFVIYYQPQVNGVTDKLTGVEALVRWQHPTMGLIYPDKFIPLAESTGLIVDIDRIVMKKAMSQVTAWYKDGLNPGVLAMNLAVKQLKQKDFFEVLEQLINETECKAEWIELEVTEGQIMSNPDEAITVLQQISDFGIELAVDDFGTGYSSLAYLKRLPIDKLKIDKMFVQELPNNEDDAGITRAVLALAKSLNLSVIAEGVETKEQKDFIVENGCEKIQGYFYSKPIPAGEMRVLLSKGFSVS